MPFKPGQSGNPSGRPPSLDRLDGWASAFTGIGMQGYDKRLGAQFQGANLSYQTVIDLWTKDDMARRCIEYAPSEAFREGYEIHIADEGAFDDLKDQLDQKLQDLEVDKLLERALCMDRALGGAAILVGYDDGKALNLPVDPLKVKGIKWFSLLEPIELQPIQFYTLLTDQKYGAPKMYNLTGISPGSNTYLEGREAPPNGLIHESRLIMFEGIKVSHYQLPSTIAGSFWGESVLAALVEILRDFHISWHAAGLLATDFSQPTLSIPNLMNLVAKHGSQLRDRLAAIEMTRSVARVVAIDSKETYERKTTPLAGFAELLTQISLRLSAATGIPLRLLMGQIPTTIGESDTDIRVFYDHVRGLQKKKIGPILRQIVTILMKSMRKYKVPKRWSVKFNPLWVLTDQEKAEARLTQARADSMYIKMGAVTPNEIRFSRFGGDYSYLTNIVETDDAPGIPMPPTMGGGAGGGADANKKYPVAAPGGTPGAGAVTNNHAAPGGPAHGVRGYARKNPTPNPLASNPKEGGDVAPENRRDRHIRFDSNGIPITLIIGNNRRDCTTNMLYMLADGRCVVWDGTPEHSEQIDNNQTKLKSRSWLSTPEREIWELPGYNNLDNMNMDSVPMQDLIAPPTSDDGICPDCGDETGEGKHECGVPNAEDVVTDE